MNRSMIAAVVGCAGLAASAMGQLPAYTAQSRWVITGVNTGATATAGAFISTPGSDVVIPATGATAILLTLQARTVFAQNFASSGTADARVGNFNVYTVGFGSAGTSQPTTITRAGAIAGTALARGDWGFLSVANGGESGSAILRGAAPGARGPNTDNFPVADAEYGNARLRGLRFWQAYTAAGNNATGNTGIGATTMPNGFIDANGNITDMNLLRTLYARPADAAEFSPGHAVWQAPTQVIDDGMGTFASPGNRGDDPAWFDVYRVLLTSTTPLVLGSGLNVTFNGYIAPAINENLSNNNLNLVNPVTGSQQQTTATISFGQVIPGPGAAALMGLGTLLAARRRR